MIESISKNLFIKISALLENSQKRVLNIVNQTMVLTYFEIGKMLVEEEQSGKERADYGKFLILYI